MWEELIYEGNRFTIRGLRLADGSCPVLDFLNRLPDSERAKLQALFVRMGDTGQIRNKQKFKIVENSNLIAFKSHQIRILGFFGRARGEILLAHALLKKTDKYKQTEIERVEGYREWYFSQAGGGGDG